MALNDIVKVNISRENSTTTQKGFGVLLILTGDALPDDARVKTYKTLTEVAEDFDSVTPTYQMAIAAFSGDLSPEEIMVGYQNRVESAETPTDALDLIRAVNDDWYAVSTDLSEDTNILEIAGYIQALKKLYFAQSQDASILAEATEDDIASLLLADGLNRTAIIYEATEQYSGTAWAGQYLLHNPGTLNWAHKTLNGVTVTKLTGAEKNSAHGKLCNTYTTTAGRNTTQFGFTSELGTYIDIIRAIDWIEARMQEGIFGRLVASLKVPYNEAGFAVIAAEVEAVLTVAEGDTVINAGWTVSVPKLADISQADKNNRHFVGITFVAVLAGSINTVTIHGNIT